jgi:glycosyltransferase involved in cell wall biosynthesis
MILALPKKEDGIGGGWSFVDNLYKGCNGLYTITDCLTGGDWNYALIPAATMISWGDFQILTAMRDTNRKPKGKKVFLRVDGIPEDFRNRGTGWSRLKGYAQAVDGVIYQSEFSRDTVGRLLGKGGTVIYNGLDRSVFKPEGEKFPTFGNPSIICVNYRNDPNKRVQEVIERFRYYKLDNPGAKLTFVGDYPKQQFLWDNMHWDFGMLDLKQNEDWQFMGILKDKNVLAKAMRSSDYIAFPSFADPMPNTLIEAMCCGCKPLWTNPYGGQAEVVNKWGEIDWSCQRMAKEYMQVFEGGE